MFAVCSVFKLGIVASSLLLVAEPALAQETPNSDSSPLIEIKEKLMYFKVGYGPGFSVPIYQNGKLIELGFFGANADAVFGAFPAALDSAREFRTKRLAGFALSAVGTAALLGGLGYVAYIGATSDQTTIDAHGGSIIGLAAGGFIVSMIGAWFEGNATMKLTEAVNRYNAGLINKHLPPKQKIDINLLLSMNQQGLGLRYHF